MKKQTATHAAPYRSAGSIRRQRRYKGAFGEELRPRGVHRKARHNQTSACIQQQRRETSCARWSATAISPLRGALKPRYMSALYNGRIIGRRNQRHEEGVSPVPAAFACHEAPDRREIQGGAGNGESHQLRSRGEAAVRPGTPSPRRYAPLRNAFALDGRAGFCSKYQAADKVVAECWLRAQCSGPRTLRCPSHAKG